MSEVYCFRDLARDFETQGINVYDVFGHSNHFNEWCDAKGLGQIDPEGDFRSSSKTWFSDYVNCPDGISKRPPAKNLWHWFLDRTEHQQLRKGVTNGLFVDVTVTQKTIDSTAWVSAIMSPMLAMSGGELTIRLTLT